MTSNHMRTGIMERVVRRGLFRPIRLMGRAVASRWPFPVRASLRDGSASMWVDLRSAIGRAIFVKGEFDPGVWDAIRQFLLPGCVFLDVGANVGYYALLAARYIGAAGRVHAFEIDGRPLRCLRRNAALSRYGNVAVHEVAVTHAVGTAVLKQAPDSGHTSLVRTGVGRVERTVQTTTLDAWLARTSAVGEIAVVKMDIEGGELAALSGARELLSRYHPVIICEADAEIDERGISPQAALIAFFEENGYSVRLADNVFSPTIVAEYRGCGAPAERLDSQLQRSR